MRFLSFIIFLAIGIIYIFPQSPHGKNLKIDCSFCHESTDWKTIPKEIKFDHNKETSFKLTGQHEEVSCQSCHTSLIFSEVKSECISCHKDVHQNTLGPECESCHTSNTWIVSNIIQIHQNSRFPLVGVHLNSDCQSCHAGYDNLLFPPQSISCFSCHAKQYYATTSPNHLQSNFSTECRECHNLTSFTWGNTNFNHDFFPLVGGHSIVNCFSCHKQGTNFKGLSGDCYSCHNQQYIQTKNPDHVQAKFSTACQDCHNIYSFTQATFNHNTTGFPLTGAHVSVSCQTCHVSGYVNTSSDCYSCHNKDFAGTTDPNHVIQGFPHNCSQCHSTTNWGGASFDHSETGFPLTGAHAATTCQSCHSSGYTNTPSDCYSCHSRDYANTTDPNHTAQGFSHDCSQCHSTTNWGDANFNHSTTGFALTGAHTTVTCQSCHTSGYTNTSSDCYSCHSKDFAGTTDPNHVTQGFPHNCSQCHSTINWSGAAFDHNTTGFALTGTHATITCQSCHSSGYINTPSDCYSCHSQDYANTTDPNHSAQGFSHDCSQCHSTTNWGDANFNHSTTGFALLGAHASTTCQSCHTSGYTIPPPTACYSCHQANYQATTNPNHTSAGLPHTCQDCHSTTSWSPSTFSHNSTGFTLTGAHVSLDCSSCHKGTVTGLTTDCYSCHSQDYSNTTDPPHSTQGFPHDCTQCHSTTNWSGATFDHNSTGFPLTGAHTGVSCQSCHTSGYVTVPPTSCFGCHANDYNGTSNPPHQSAGYPTDCTQCHTTTAWSPSTFDHTTYFPLTGSHNVSCGSCHQTISNFAIHSCNVSCHQNAHHQNEDCYNCHKTGRGD